MKKIKILLALATVLAANSCSEEFLNVPPQDSLTEETFYRNASEIRRVTASIYGSRLWFDLNDKFLINAGDAMPGDMRYEGSADEPQFYNLNFTENNGIILQGWRGLYRVIATSNSIINAMPPVARKNGAPEADILAGVAEARFLRAVAYFYLTEFWKDVPIIENASELLSSGDIKVPKNTQKSIYEFIRRDLEFAETNLPPADEPGRVTSWSAKGMLAKLHLTMASHLGDADSQSNFTKAKEYAADVIENSGLVLLGSYADLFTLQGNNSSESLFALQFTNQGWGTGNSRQANLIRNSLLGGGQGWGGGRNMTIAFIDNLYANASVDPSVAIDSTAETKDRRRKSIYMKQGDHYPELQKKYGGYTYNNYKEYPDNDPNEDFAGTTEEPSDVLNNIKKFVVGTIDDMGVSFTDQDIPMAQPVLRLADIYLIYVEATIGSGNETSDGTALGYLNAIRNRAGLFHRATVTLDQVFSERRVEFAMESINWFDIKRRYYRNEQAAIDHLNGERRSWRYYLKVDGTPVEERNDRYKWRVEEEETIITATPEKMILPIPIAELTVNSKLAPSVPAEDYQFKIN
jgi:hypothetical protein